MTKVIYREDKEGIYFELINHAGNSEACIAVSSICNVMVCYMDMFEYYSPNELEYEEGHVKCVCEGFITEGLRCMFRAVFEALKAAEKEFPGAIVIC